jgi:23S rRNA (cytidine1920-2'-O)/16S rRNA (cytidine1409-2'-O)-methyltransferase
MKKERIDKLLHERGLADSRTKAQAMVMAGVVLVDERRVEKRTSVSKATHPSPDTRAAAG